MNQMDMNGWSYEFPKETIDWSLDEARKKYEQNDFLGSIEAMIDHFDVLKNYHLLNAFADAALQTGHKEAIYRLLEAENRGAKFFLRRGVIEKLKHKKIHLLA